MIGLNLGINRIILRNAGGTGIPTPSLTLTLTSPTEGTGAGTTNIVATATVNRNGVAGDMTGTYAVSATSTATGADFVGGSLPTGSFTILDGQSSASWNLSVNRDSLGEGYEAVVCNASLDGYAGTAAVGFGGIIDDDITPYVGQVATRSYEANNIAGSGGKTGTDRTIHTLTESVGSSNPMNVVYGNYGVLTSSSSGNTGSGVETACVNDITISCNVEYPVGTTIGALSFNGTASQKIPGNARGEIVGIYSGTAIPAGAVIGLSVTFVIGTGGSGATGGAPYTQVPAGTVEATALGDGPFIIGGSQVVGAKFFPKEIYAKTTKPSFLLVGDSRCIGQYGAPDASGATGEIASSISNYAYINAGVPSDSATWYTSGRNAAARQTRAARVSHIIYQLGVNDLNRGTTAAQLMALDATAIAALKASNPNVVVFVTTIAPKSASTDNWATVAGQTTDATVNPPRLTVNQARRAGSYQGSTATFDTATAVESAQDSGLWQANGTANFYTEGLHESAAANALIKNSGAIPANWAQSNPTQIAVGPNLIPSTTPNFQAGKSGFGQELTTGSYGFTFRADGTDVLPVGQTWTMEGVIEIASAPGAVSVAFGVGNRGWIGVSSDGKLVGAYQNTGGTTTYVNGTSGSGGGTNPSIIDSARHHVALVVTPTAVTLWKDGAQVGSASTTAPSSTIGSSTIGVGTYGANGSYMFKGTVDEVAIWGTTAKYTAAFTTPAAPYAGTETGLTGLWHLDGNYSSAMKSTV